LERAWRLVVVAQEQFDFFTGTDDAADEATRVRHGSCFQ